MCFLGEVDFYDDDYNDVLFECAIKGEDDDRCVFHILFCHVVHPMKKKDYLTLHIAHRFVEL